MNKFLLLLAILITSIANSQIYQVDSATITDVKNNVIGTYNMYNMYVDIDRRNDLFTEYFDNSTIIESTLLGNSLIDTEQRVMSFKKKGNVIYMKYLDGGASYVYYLGKKVKSINYH